MIELVAAVLAVVALGARVRRRWRRHEPMAVRLLTDGRGMPVVHREMPHWTLIGDMWLCEFTGKLVVACGCGACRWWQGRPSPTSLPGPGDRYSA